LVFSVPPDTVAMRVTASSSDSIIGWILPVLSDLNMKARIGPTVQRETC